jgi:hypothetical protein
VGARERPVREKLVPRAGSHTWEKGLNGGFMAPPGGHSTGGKSSAGPRAVAVAVWTAALFGAFLASSLFSASAALTHPYIGSFGPDGTAATIFEHPGPIAADQSNGDIYVGDIAADAVYRFGPEGEARDFGTSGSNKVEGIGFSAAEPSTNQIAVNEATHQFYVTEPAPENAIKVFEENGEPGEFSTLSSSRLTGFGELCGVAVDSNGDIYAGDFAGTVSVFAPDGEPVASFATEEPCNLAVSSTGVVYVTRFSGQIERFVPSEYPIGAGATWSDEEVVYPGIAFGLSVDRSTDDLYVVGTAGLGEPIDIQQISPSGAVLGKFAESGPGAISQAAGVAVATGAGVFAAEVGKGQVNRYGPAEAETATIESEWVSGIGAEEATLHAEIDARGSTTSYRFEYGPEDCSLGGCSALPDTTLGAEEEALAVAATLTGLRPGATYHFRVVATQGSKAIPGQDKTFTTHASGAAGSPSLPDGRAFELVSPQAPGSAEVGAPKTAGGAVLGYPKPQRAAASGESLAFASFTAFGDAQGAPGASEYLARRGADGWTDENITPSDVTRALDDPLRGFTPDLRYAGVVQSGALLALGAVPGFQNIYLRDDETGALTPLVTEPPLTTSPGEYCVTYAGAAGDGRTAIFAAHGDLTPGAPAPGPSELGTNLYAWSAGGGLRLISILPGEGPAPLNPGTGFGPGGDVCGSLPPISRNAISDDGSRIFWTWGGFGTASKLLAAGDGAEPVQVDASQGGPDPGGEGRFLAAAADGSRVIFSDQERLVPGATEGDLYEYDFSRPEGSRLVDLTGGGGEPTKAQGILGASENAEYVYFVALGALGAGATAGEANLYLAHAGEVRFIATLDGATDKEDWSREFATQSAEVTPDGEQLAFVSTVPLTGYSNEIGGHPTCRLDSEGNPEGGKRCDEVYLYDATGPGELSCASCNPDGSAPTLEPQPTTANKLSRLNNLPPWGTPAEQPRYLSTDGDRLFFLSEEALVGGDTDERQDVYEFERPGSGSCTTASPSYVAVSKGCVFLISGGQSDDDSWFVDASADGRDVFFSTRQSLVGEDEDERFDVYDAREGGGFPKAAGGAPGCAGEACRPAASSPPAASPPASSTLVGKGNVRPRHCPKNKVRKGGKCVARKAHRKSRGKHRRHAHAASGARRPGSKRKAAR